MALGKFAINHEDSVAEHFRMRLTAHTIKLRETARTDPNVTVVVYDPKSDKYKKELASAPASDPNPAGSKRSRGAPDDTVDLTITTGVDPIDELNLDKAVPPTVEKPVQPPWEIIKAPTLRARYLLTTVFHSEEPQWGSVKLHRIEPFWSTSAKKLPRFTENMLQHHRGQAIGTYPKVLTDHWGQMQFMSTSATEENAYVATTVEEGILILEGIRFECHAWQTLSDPGKILLIEDQEEWRKHDVKHPPKNKHKRGKAKRQPILEPATFKSKHAVRQQWNMNGESWAWADMAHGGILDHPCQNLLLEYTGSDGYKSLTTTSLASVSDMGVTINALCYQRMVKWNVKKMSNLRKWNHNTGAFFAQQNIETISKMVKDDKEGPMSVVKQMILLPLPSKRFLKMAPETKLFLKIGVKDRMLIEDEERAALRYNVLTREYEFFPGSYLTCRPGCPKSSLLGMKNAILRYAGLRMCKEKSGKEVNRAYKSNQFVALEADVKTPGCVPPTIVDPRRIRMNLPAKIAEARACLTSHFACQCMPINQKPFATICERHTAPDSDKEWKEYQGYIAEVLGSLQTLDKLICDASTHAQAEVYFIQRKLAEVIVPDETLCVIYGVPDHKSDLIGGKTPCLKIEVMMAGRVPFQQTTAEGSSDSSAPNTAAQTAAASNLDDQDMVNGDATVVGVQGPK
jgi:hypothetical protein